MPYDSLSTGGESGTIAFSLDRKLAVLGPRQREIARIVYSQSAVTPREVQQRLSELRSLRVIRTLLDRLVSKGLVRRRATGRHREIVYIAAIPTPGVREAAIQKLVSERFGGSVALAAIALLEIAKAESRLAEQPPRTMAAIRRRASDALESSLQRRAVG